MRIEIDLLQDGQELTPDWLNEQFAKINAALSNLDESNIASGAEFPSDMVPDAIPRAGGEITGNIEVASGVKIDGQVLSDLGTRVSIVESVQRSAVTTNFAVSVTVNGGTNNYEVSGPSEYVDSDANLIRISAPTGFSGVDSLVNITNAGFQQAGGSYMSGGDHFYFRDPVRSSESITLIPETFSEAEDVETGAGYIVWFDVSILWLRVGVGV